MTSKPITTNRRAALYMRVSTTNGQTTDNQRLELEAWAKRSGIEIAAVFEDNGISGAKGRDKRPGLDAMLKAATRREFDVIAAWSVDRLGRSLQDLIATLGELHAAGVDLVLLQQGLDTRSPAGKAMFGMLGVFAEFERSIIRERVNAGLARARKQGKKLGRPKAGYDVERRIVRLRGQGAGINAIAKKIGCGSSTVRRVLAEHE